MKRERQIRSASKKDKPLAKLLPRSDMNTLASGGDKESNEPLRRAKKGATQQTSVGRKPGR